MKIPSIYIVLFLLLLFLGGFYAGYKHVTNRNLSHVEYDTLEVVKYYAITDTIQKWFPKYDTVFIVIKDSVQFPMAIETLDTLLIHGRDSLDLNIKRYPYPEVYYSLAYKINRRDSIQIIKETNYLEKPDGWLNRFNIGIGPGISLFKDGDNIKAAPSVNLSLYYKLF